MAISKRELVNHPDHYNKHPSGVECIDIVEHMSFNLGNAVKYIWRAGAEQVSGAEVKILDTGYLRLIETWGSDIIGQAFPRTWELFIGAGR